MSKTKVTKLPKSEVEIEGELAENIFEAYFPLALKRIFEDLEIDGFRKGKAPEHVVLSRVPEKVILEEMAEMALREHYPKILEDEKIDAISQPEIAITKLARKNPLGFKIKTAVLPEVKLPDYKALAKKILSSLSDKDKDTSVSDEEVENTILDIRKSRAPKKHVTEGAEEKELEGKEELPEWNDEFVKGLGPFDSVEDFKTKLKENLKIEKANLQKEKTRIKIIEGVIEDSELEVPDILVELELNKILARMESDITQMGLKFEDYLKHLNKTAEDLRKEFRKDGEKKAKLALILNAIAKAEKIVADQAKVEQEVEQILAHYKDADPDRARAHVEEVLTNELIFALLEKDSA